MKHCTSGDPLIDIRSLVDRIPPRRLRLADASTIAYRETGSGTPIVLLHGIGSSAASWTQVMTILTRSFRAIAWDAPGYGESSPVGPSNPTAADYSAALAGMLDALAIDRAIVVGHSLGALIAGRFAADHPDRVPAMALINPASGYGLADPSIRAERLNSRLELMNKLGPEGMAAQRAQHLLGPNASPAALALVQWSMRQLHPAGHEQAARMLADGRLIEDAARYRGPVLVVGATADRITPEAGCRAIAAACARAEYRSLPDLGHASYVEAPQIVADLLTEFAHVH